MKLQSHSIFTSHLIEIMIALKSSFQEDQNQPKYHLILTRESVFLNYESTCAYLIMLALNQSGHPWKAINTSDLYLILETS